LLVIGVALFGLVALAVEPSVPISAATGVRLTTVAGVDRWSDSGGGVGGEARLAAAYGRIRNRLMVRAVGSGRLEILPGSSLPYSDAMVADLTAARIAPWQPGVGVRVRSAAVGVEPWGELLASLQARRDLGSGVSAALWLGVAGRGEAAVGAVGPDALLSLRWRGARHVVEGVVEGQVLGHGLPPAVFRPSIRTEIQIGQAVLEVGVAGVWATAEADDANPNKPDKPDKKGASVATAGLPDPGAGQAGLWTGVSTPIGGPVRAMVELGGERGLGTDDYVRGRALAGVVFVFNRQTRVGVAPLRSGHREFSLSAPDASSVSILGSFTAWEPLPLARGRGGRWRVEVALGAGEHEYAYMVDGIVVVPPEAVRTRDDGFGGVNGVIVVLSSDVME
jgi:hypothetical protein